MRKNRFERKTTDTPIPFGELESTAFSGKHVVGGFADPTATQGMSDRTNYNFNSKGYRSEEFSDTRHLKVLTVGCSESFGVGLAPEYRFSGIFCELLKERGITAVDYNLSLPAQSNDYIARTLIGGLSLKPDIILVCFTFCSRREYVDHRDERCRVQASMPRKLVGTSYRKTHDCFQYLSNPYEDRNNFLKNLALVKLATEEHSCFFSNIDKDISDLLKKHEPERYVGFYKFMDKAFDGLHRGAESHRLLAQTFFSRYMEDSPRRIAAEGEEPRCTI